MANILPRHTLKTVDPVERLALMRRQTPREPRADNDTRQLKTFCGSAMQHVAMRLKFLFLLFLFSQKHCVPHRISANFISSRTVEALTTFN